ncbi:hypothetical protein MXB_2549 [Myxobolus squamalis]|nr:hypothetical protein MXB_2549 [Myxobolus squamalis]
MFFSKRTLWLNLLPLSLSIDFEQATVSAPRSTFYDFSIYGCLFYLTKKDEQKNCLMRVFFTNAISHLILHLLLR